MELKRCPFCESAPWVGPAPESDQFELVACCDRKCHISEVYMPTSKWQIRPIEDAQSAEIARLTARVAELEGMLREIVDSIPSTYDETDPTVIRHAAALNAAWNRFKEVGRDG